MVTRNVQKCAISRFWWDKGKTGPSFHRRDLKIENQMSWNREVHSILDLVTKENVNVYYLHNHVSRWLHILLCRKSVSVQLLLTVVSHSNESLPIMPLSFHWKKRGCKERMGASWQLSFECKILIWIGCHCITISEHKKFSFLFCSKIFNTKYIFLLLQNFNAYNFVLKSNDKEKILDHKYQKQ